MIKNTIAFLISIIMCVFSSLGFGIADKYKVENPSGFSSYTEKESSPVTNADYYVSASGNDNNPGTFEQPFATLERAKTAVRSTDKTGRSGITVAVMAGEYRVDSLKFDASDSGTQSYPIKYCAYGDGEVVINGGVTLDSSKFKAVTDASVLERLSDKAKSNVVCFDLGDDNITAEDYGKIYAIGSYNTASKYTGDWTGPLYCELFVNDTRMTLARYPDSDFLKTGEVVSTGEGYESGGSLTVNEDWDTIVNPESDVYKVESALADRIASWQTLDDVWMFGFWKYDWADASSPVGEFSYENKTISPKFVSLYGTKEGAPYYFFNILEELDSPGEWYLDRESGILYLYPPVNLDSASIDMSLSTDFIIEGNNADYISFEGFTIKGTRGDAINITGNNVSVKNCLIKNVAGNAVILNGYNNLVSECEITHTGKGGIILSGGDRVTLTPSNSKADNNLIHDWSEIYQTYQAAVRLEGVGNVCSHNEIFNSPHEAVTYSGNNHTIEYNLIHDVCLLSDDAGAIYSGRSWIDYGSVVRYNCIYNLGSGDHTPDGIYLDDALSGQAVYGNLLINVPKFAIHLGGGRDLDVRNNIIINTNTRSVSYDQRAIDGVSGGWFTHAAKGGDMWQNLYASPWQTQVWQTAYPQMQRFSDDFNDTDTPDFVPNPAYSTVTGNVIVNLKGNIGFISESAQKLSTIEGNAIFRMTNQFRIFTDPLNGDYSLCKDSLVYQTIPDFEELPVSNMGRY